MSHLRLAAALVTVSVIATASAAVFSVGHANEVSRDGTRRLHFTNVMADDLRGWQYQKGYYRVLESGFYYLTFHGLSVHNRALTMAVYRNNDELFTGYGSAHDYSTASSSGIAYLQRGDYLTLRIIDGTVHESTKPLRAYVAFSGFKIAGSSRGGGGGFFPLSGGGGGGFSHSGSSGGGGGHSGGGAFSGPPASTQFEEDVKFRPLEHEVGGPE